MLDPATTLITISNIGGNLLPATIGNVIGGAFVALSYYTAYGKPATNKHAAK
jgi:formate transporter